MKKLLFLLSFITVSVCSQEIDIQSLMLKNSELDVKADFINTHDSYDFIDIDADGDLDLFSYGMLGLDDFNVNVSQLYLNDGTGSFSVKENTGLPYGVSKAAFADVDLDGDLDVLLNENDVTLYLNDGQASFKKSTKNDFGRFEYASVFFEDFNGDSFPDILVGIPQLSLPGFIDYEAETTVFLNDGSGVFSEKTDAFFYDIHNPSSVLMTDLDKDGFKDILLFNGLSRVLFYQNNGAAEFHPTMLTLDGKINFQDVVLDVGDVNNDQLDDIVVYSYTSEEGRHTDLYINKGNLVFERQENNPFFSEERVKKLSLFDLDSDGDLDFVETLNTVPKTLRLFVNEAAVFSEIEHSGIANLSNNFKLADLNGDGFSEVLFYGEVNHTSELENELYFNIGPGLYQSSKSGTLRKNSYTTVVPADVDNDGDIDLLCGGAFYQPVETALLLNDGTGFFTPSEGQDFINFLMNQAAFSDVDNDDDMDLLLMHSDTAIIYYNDGLGGFPIHHEVFIDKTYNRKMDFVDLDMDGNQDILMYSVIKDRLMAYYNKDGGGWFELGVETNVPAEKTFAVVDINQDGISDVFSITDEGAYFYTNDGSGVFTLMDSSGIDALANAAIHFSDLDGDGDMDLLLAGKDALRPTTRLYWNRGEGVFEKEPLNYFMNVSYAGISDIDIDSDGDTDIVLSGGSVNNVIATKLYVNDGAGAFTEWADFPLVGLLRGKVHKADLDGDQDLDLISAGTGPFNDHLRVYENRTCWPIPNNAIDFDGQAISVPEGDLDYQWIKCDENNLVLDGKTEAVFYPYEIGSYAVVVSNSNCRLVSDCVDFSTADLENVESRLYPNPSTDFIILEATSEELSSLHVYNYLGQEMNAFVAYNYATENTLRLNIAKLESGLYFLQTKNEFLKFSKL